MKLQFTPWLDDPDPPPPKLSKQELEKFSAGVGKVIAEIKAPRPQGGSA